MQRAFSIFVLTPPRHASETHRLSQALPRHDCWAGQTNRAGCHPARSAPAHHAAQALATLRRLPRLHQGRLDCQTSLGSPCAVSKASVKSSLRKVGLSKTGPPPCISKNAMGSGFASPFRRLQALNYLHNPNLRVQNSHRKTTQISPNSHLFCVSFSLLKKGFFII